MSRPGIFNAGYCLQYVWQKRESLAAETGLPLDALMRTLSTFHLDEISRRTNFDAPSELSSFIVAILTDQVQRGLPTFPSLEVERSILEPLALQGAIRERVDDSGGIVFEECRRPAFLSAQWPALLARAHITVHPDLAKDARDLSVCDSQAERNFSLDTLRPALGVLWQFVELQRPLSELLPLEQQAAFAGQRLDFDLAIPGTRQAIELDGPEHLNAAQKKHDEERDSALSEVGWTTLRVLVQEMQLPVTKDKLSRAYAANDFTKGASENLASPLNSTREGMLALHLVLAPYAIARIQRTLLHALETGALSLQNKIWRVAAVERDVDCVLLAIADFQRQLQRLLILLGEHADVPRVDLTVYRGDTFQIPDQPSSFIQQESVRVTYRFRPLASLESDAERVADIFLDVAVLQHQGFSPTPAPWINNLLGPEGTAYTLRSAYDAHDVRRVATEFPRAYAVDSISEPLLISLLQDIFRKNKFKDGQLQILLRSLGLQPVIGLLPTGAGKSVCYQMSALMQPGMTIVVDPILSLMKDQETNLKSIYAIDWVQKISSLDNHAAKETVAQDMSVGRIKILLLTPERLHMQPFRERLASFCFGYPIPYAVIDEAHCVSEWGHDFRTAYLRLADTIRTYCKHNQHEPAFIALTGTASFVVLSDVQRELGVTDERALVYPKTFDRKEIHYRVVLAPTSQKFLTLQRLMQQTLPDEMSTSWKEMLRLQKKATRSGIIFTPHANGDFGPKTLVPKLVAPLDCQIGEFTGQTDDALKWASYDRFMGNDIPLLVATKAFGMGIDKPNIRYTIHYNLPPSIEAFYQESGRAGRDGKRASCWIILSDEAPKQINAALAPDASDATIAEAANAKAGDAHRILWLHRNTYRGVKAEIDTTLKVYKDFFASEFKGVLPGFALSFPVDFADAGVGSEMQKQQQMERDKGLHRLALLGIVKDYSLDYRSKQFEVTAQIVTDEELIHGLQDYVGRYKMSDRVRAIPLEIDAQEGDSFLSKCLSLLVSFVYTEIERKRRVALFTMLEVARHAGKLATPFDQDLYIRQEMRAYLEKSPFTDPVAALSLSENPRDWLAILLLRDEVGVALLYTIDGVRQLLGACRRTLESYPNHPGLLFLMSISRLLLPDPDIAQAVTEARSAFHTLAQSERDQDMLSLLKEYRRRLRSLSHGTQAIRAIADVALEERPSRLLARALFPDSPELSRSVIYHLLLTDLRALNQRLNS